MKWALTVVVLCCYSLAVIKARSTRSLDTKSQIDDYVKQIQREYAANILAMEAELDAHKLNCETQFQIMELQSKLLQDNMQEVDRNLKLFSSMSKLIGDCVNKYHNELATVYSVKSDIAGCITSAHRTLGVKETSAKATKGSLEFWYNNYLSSEISKCYSNNHSSLELMACITSTMEKADSVTDSYQKTFKSQMNAMSCDKDNQLLDCVYTIFYKTVPRIGEVTQKINNCSQGNELKADKSNFCNFSTFWNGNSLSFFGNKTLKSPFQDGKTIPCLLLKFKS